LFEFCLEQSYRVHYGISENRKKKLSVPFKHADVPSERSEFSHPDVGILLSLLAYYHKGLTNDQFREAIRTLLKNGISTQKHFYSRWYSSISDEVTTEESMKINDITKIDPSNQTQIELIFKKFKKSTEVINFWLNYHIFNVDTC
jgi:hypothetical protein